MEDTYEKLVRNFLTYIYICIILRKILVYTFSQKFNRQTFVMKIETHI